MLMKKFEENVYEVEMLNGDQGVLAKCERNEIVSKIISAISKSVNGQDVYVNMLEAYDELVEEGKHKEAFDLYNKMVLRAQKECGRGGQGK